MRLFWAGLAVALCFFVVACSGSRLHTVPMPTQVHCPTADAGLRVSICDMDIAAHRKNPSAHPMFREQVQHYCRSSSQPVPFDELELMMNKNGVAPAAPSGFVFHMTRCGSTLIGNMFATLPHVTMLTESQPPVQLLGCNLPEKDTVDALRTLVRAMGEATRGQNVIFKFQSALVPKAGVLLQAFPETPVVFLYRDPIEVMASNLATRHGPCLRFRQHQRAIPQRLTEVSKMTADELRSAPTGQACAAYLGYLMNLGAEIVSTANTGLALPYTELPDAVPDTLAPLFGVTVSDVQKRTMLEQGAIYSKARKNTRQTFRSDSEKKKEAMQGDNARYALQLTAEPFAALGRLSRQHKAQPSLEGPPDGVEPTDDTIDYPQYFPLSEILDWWNPDVQDIPADVDRYNTLAKFDYRDPDDLAKATQFRNAELPFIVFNIPSLEQARLKWTDEYLSDTLGRKFGVETSPDNHFMYYNKHMTRRGVHSSIRKAGWHKPTKEAFMSYPEWLEKAEARPLTNNDTHYYFRASSGTRATKFISRDLRYFNARSSESKLFIVDETRQRGIHCRFGMRGIIAECHYDGGRNYVSMIRGHKRYILQPPSQCKHLKMLKYPHPSARHSSVDWSNRYVPYERHSGEDNVADEAFDRAASINVVLGPGEAMYMPSFWFHYIVSLDTNIQCNSRSGTPPTAVHWIEECGFKVNADTKGGVAEPLRAQYRKEFAEFNRPIHKTSAQSKSPDVLSEAEIRQRTNQGTGSKLVGAPSDTNLVRRSGVTRAILSSDWVMVTASLVGVVALAAVFFLHRFRNRRMHHGGSV